MLFLANMGGPSLIPDMKTALRRAKHFTKDLPFKGLFSPVSRTGLSIPIRNGLWFIDLKENTTEEDFHCELLCLHWMAKKINEWIDSHFIEDDEESKWALGAWLVRAEAWADWSKLDEKE